MSEEKRGRGRPKLPRDEYGNIIREPKPAPMPQPAQPVPPQPEPAQPAPVPSEPEQPKSPEQKGDEYFYLSVADYMAAAGEQPVNPVNIENYQRVHEGKRRGSWIGLPFDANTADVTQLVNDGWTDGAAKLSRLSEGLEMPEITSSKRRLRWREEGDELDHQRLYAGDLERMWRRPVRTSQRQPARYRVTVQTSANWRTGADELFWRGAAALVLSDILTGAGHSVEITGKMGTNWGEKKIANFVIKDFDQPVNLASLASVTALAAFFRTVGFSWIVSKARTFCPESLGQAITFTQRGMDKTDVEQGFFVGDTISNEETARKWLTEQLQQFMPQQEAA